MECGSYAQIRRNAGWRNGAESHATKEHGSLNRFGRGFKTPSKPLGEVSLAIPRTTVSARFCGTANSRHKTITASYCASSIGFCFSLLPRIGVCFTRPTQPKTHVYSMMSITPQRDFAGWPRRFAALSTTTSGARFHSCVTPWDETMGVRHLVSPASVPFSGGDRRYQTL